MKVKINTGEQFDPIPSTRYGFADIAKELLALTPSDELKAELNEYSERVHRAYPLDEDRPKPERPIQSKPETPAQEYWILLWNELVAKGQSEIRFADFAIPALRRN